jgi:Icc-related predicted phosphoesterase
MKVYVASDLHFEFPGADRRAMQFPEDADVIVLAGDIAVGANAAKEAIALAARYPSAHVVWVAGNHEFYRRNIDDTLEMFQHLCKDHPRVHYLENESVQIGDFLFLGCTLWTDFTLLGEPPRAIAIADRSITDFAIISTEYDRRFTPQDAIQRFQESRGFLDRELSAGDPQTTVIVTHFPPGLDTRNRNFPPDAVTAYFQSNVDDLIDKHQPRLWLYGHNHFSNDLWRGATRLVSNQLGYPSELGSIPAYDANKVILLNKEEA